MTLGPNLGMFPLEQTRRVGVAKSECPRLTNGEIIFEKFQPMWSQLTNVTDRQRDGQTTCDRNTALCTKVHRAVKIVRNSYVIIVLEHTVKANYVTDFKVEKSEDTNGQLKSIK